VCMCVVVHTTLLLIAPLGDWASDVELNAPSGQQHMGTVQIVQTHGTAVHMWALLGEMWQHGDIRYRAASAACSVGAVRDCVSWLLVLASLRDCLFRMPF